MKSFQRSEAFLERAQRTIPLGSQTFSKSRTQYPHGVSPYFITRGQGSRVWDLDGNEYIDFVSSLCSVTLGYQDPDVTNAVRTQLDESGVIFSLPHPLEAEVAELICEMVPCAEMVRFGKNGSDATSGAIRLARAWTERDRVAVSGYHGWQDWYIGSTARNRGVPQATRELTHTFTYNNLESLETLLKAHPGEFAAVILEPMNVAEPQPGFLEGVKALAHAHGALLVFDETITGFRYANGGAQQLFGVTPDLATFGKGLANGYPVSAVAGRADVMKLMEEIFFSFTFGGEALSLAAAKATLTKLKNEPVVQTIEARGRAVIDGTRQVIESAGLGDIFSMAGHPSWSFLMLKDARGATSFEIKTLLMQELHQRGFLSVGTHNISYAHSEADVQALLAAYGDILPMIGRTLDAGTLRQSLRCEPLVPLFKVR
ncbi:aminotransferase class III-fold pyridoxal phosphate-dependent enzyme [Ideonella sp. 4Y16]|uniref:Aminotransferase class III-fold pyridoxal phosphate-dependent enzyme n=1 Tax=Ideonella alba TaxID=2824118 RepID=A0A940Y8I0_9BURK|nr:aminotransferase class III-fold pyridoxal phosphate-dependent enzyme [Ideonella alba]MBQ0929633.1 aminotransferase class III-fold pyridoxal phosphate-dependent enzyme [Ideonella alba]MBQ0941875.1 aminotransferase class III-fold pyridoxal phosphate-dependent enzyme [Ideonella alba]